MTNQKVGGRFLSFLLAAQLSKILEAPAKENLQKQL